MSLTSKKPNFRNVSRHLIQDSAELPPSKNSSVNPHENSFNQENITVKAGSSRSHRVAKWFQNVPSRLFTCCDARSRNRTIQNREISQKEVAPPIPPRIPLRRGNILPPTHQAASSIPRKQPVVKTQSLSEETIPPIPPRIPLRKKDILSPTHQVTSSIPRKQPVVKTQSLSEETIPPIPPKKRDILPSPHQALSSTETQPITKPQSPQLNQLPFAIRQPVALAATTNKTPPLVVSSSDNVNSNARPQNTAVQNRKISRGEIQAVLQRVFVIQKLVNDLTEISDAINNSEPVKKLNEKGGALNLKQKFNFLREILNILNNETLENLSENFEHRKAKSFIKHPLRHLQILHRLVKKLSEDKNLLNIGEYFINSADPQKLSKAFEEDIRNTLSHLETECKNPSHKFNPKKFDRLNERFIKWETDINAARAYLEQIIISDEMPSEIDTAFKAAVQRLFQRGDEY